MQSSILPMVFLAVSAAIAQTNRVQPILIEDAGFLPSGWMGDAAKPIAADKHPLQVDLLNTVNPHSPPYCEQWTYKPKLGRAGWAAVAWQFPEGNWGDKPGKDWSKRGFGQASVWARGTKDRQGKLPKVQFKAGGGTDPTKKYQASFEVESDLITLTEEWKQYTLDLNGQNLSQVIAAFVLVIRGQDTDPAGATFCLDDIEYR
jgi:hypothetical protein